MLIVCTSCQSSIRVPDTAAGRKGKCPKCGTILTIPAVEAPPPAPPPSAPPPLPPTAYASEIPPPLPPEPPVVPRTPRGYDEDDGLRRRYDDDDFDDDDLSIRRPRRVGGKGMAISGMVLGLAGLLLAGGGVLVIVGGASFGQPDLCCYGCVGGSTGIAISGLLGVLGIVFGSIGQSQSGRGFAWAGIITGGLALLLVLAYVVLIILAMFGFIVVVGAAANAMQQQQQAQPPFGPPRRPR